MHKNPLSILWTGRVTIYEYQDVTSLETFQTTQELVAVVTDEPCRVSFGERAYQYGSPVTIEHGAPSIMQTITLFIRPDLDIKAGSVIEVTQNNVTTKYKRASQPAVHSNHQEVLLELYEDHA
jgi:hypothetical protein